MKVLITGGYGFIGSFVAEKFYREGYEIHILDNLSTGRKSNVSFRHQSYQLNIEDEQCEQVFRTNKFDVVVHLAAQVDVAKSIENPAEDSQINVVGLVNILQLASKYGVVKFVFASSAAVYGNNEDIPLHEDSQCNPLSPYGMNKWMGEFYCQKWSELHKIDTICFRFSNVYGPRQGAHGEGGVISIFMKKILNHEPLTIYGDGTQTRDFIYVEDVAEAIFRSVLSDVSGILNLSTNTEISINELIHYFKRLTNVKEVVYVEERIGDIRSSRLDNRKAKREVDWTPKYSLEDGLKRTYEWFKAEDAGSKEKVERDQKKIKKILFRKARQTNPILPYIENGIIFIIIAALYIYLGDLLYNFDLLLLYILTVGIFFGKVQAVLASTLSAILYSWQGLVNGREVVALFTDHNTLIQYAVYLFVGLVVGYVIDKKHFREEKAKVELLLFKEKYQFLNDIFIETKKVKDELQMQILYTEDSVGEIYSIIKKIDSLEPDEVFNGVIAVLEKIMKSNEAAVYLVGKGERYLRLVSKSNLELSTMPSSIEIQHTSPYANILRKKEFYINRELNPEMPMMVAPIVKDDHTVAVICINDISFEHLTLYHENLFHVVTNLITSSVTRAFEFAHATHHDRYIEGTSILKYEYFRKAVESKQKAYEQLNIPYALLKMDKVDQMELALERISSSLRDTDYIGMEKDGSYWMLLSNSNRENAKAVIRRFHFIKKVHFKEEEIYA